jgi:PEP-CTERM motif
MAKRISRLAFIAIGLSLFAGLPASAAIITNDLGSMVSSASGFARAMAGTPLPGPFSHESSATELAQAEMLQVPEPSSLVLLGGALIGVAAIASIISIRRRLMSKRDK